MLRRVVYMVFLLCLGICAKAHSYTPTLSPNNFEQLYSMASRGDIAGIANAINRGLNIDAVDQYGDTGLCIAARRRDRRAWKTLVKAGANPSHPCTWNIQGYDSFADSAMNVSVINNEDMMPGTYAKEGLSLTSKVLIGTGVVAATGAGIAAAVSGGGGGSSSKKNKDEEKEPDCGDKIKGSDGQCYTRLVCANGSVQVDDHCDCSMTEGYEGVLCDKPKDCSGYYETCGEGYVKTKQTCVSAGVTYYKCKLSPCGPEYVEDCGRGYVKTGETCEDEGRTLYKCRENDCISQGYSLTTCPDGYKETEICYSGSTKYVKCGACARGYDYYGTTSCHKTLNCNHGTQSGDTCECLNGWTGTFCNEPADCEGQGYYADCELGYHKTSDKCYSADQTFYKCEENDCIGQGFSQTSCPSGYKETARCYTSTTLYVKCGECLDGYDHYGTEGCHKTLDCKHSGSQVGDSCVCVDGWQGTLCNDCSSVGKFEDTDGKCYTKLNCAGHGHQEKESCVCNTGYSGTTCSECASGYGHYGSVDGTCYANLNCVHGEQRLNVCNCAEGYKGTLCTECSEGYGPHGATDGSCYRDLTDCNGEHEVQVRNECRCESGYSRDADDGKCYVSIGCLHNAMQRQGTCVCVNNWTGTLCETCNLGFVDPEDDGCYTALDCKHGGRQSKDACKCANGWQGALCNDCSSVGRFEGTDGKCYEKLSCVHGSQINESCECVDGWLGTLCEACSSVGKFEGTDGKCYEKLTCVHGSQNNDKCVCDTGYKGDTCSECANGYGPHGTTDGICYKDLTDCNGEHEVQIGGECKCESGYGYYGDTVCHETIQCNHGGHQVADTCECVDGWQGNRCSDCDGQIAGEICYPDLHCVHGTQSLDHCVCEGDWIGTTCDLCMGIRDGDLCVKDMECEYGCKTRNSNGLCTECYAEGEVDCSLPENKCVKGCYIDLSCDKGCQAYNECGGCEICNTEEVSRFSLNAYEEPINNEENLTPTPYDDGNSWGGIYSNYQQVINSGDIEITGNNGIGIMSASNPDKEQALFKEIMKGGENIYNEGNITITGNEGHGMFATTLGNIENKTLVYSGTMSNGGVITTDGKNNVGMALYGDGNLINEANAEINMSMVLGSESINKRASAYYDKMFSNAAMYMNKGQDSYAYATDCCTSIADRYTRYMPGGTVGSQVLTNNGTIHIEAKLDADDSALVLRSYDFSYPAAKGMVLRWQPCELNGSLTCYSSQAPRIINNGEIEIVLEAVKIGDHYSYPAAYGILEIARNIGTVKNPDLDRWIINNGNITISAANSESMGYSYGKIAGVVMNEGRFDNYGDITVDIANTSYVYGIYVDYLANTQTQITLNGGSSINATTAIHTSTQNTRIDIYTDAVVNGNITGSYNGLVYNNGVINGNIGIGRTYGQFGNVINRGIINGNIYLSYTLDNSGIINPEISIGVYAQTVKNATGATINGSVTTENLQNSGNIVWNVLGVKTLSNTGTIGGDLSGATTDVLTNDGIIGGTVTQLNLINNGTIGDYEPSGVGLNKLTNNSSGVVSEAYLINEGTTGTELVNHGNIKILTREGKYYDTSYVPSGHVNYLYNDSDKIYIVIFGMPYGSTFSGDMLPVIYIDESSYAGDSVTAHSRNDGTIYLGVSGWKIYTGRKNLRLAGIEVVNGEFYSDNIDFVEVDSEGGIASGRTTGALAINTAVLAANGYVDGINDKSAIITSKDMYILADDTVGIYAAGKNSEAVNIGEMRLENGRTSAYKRYDVWGGTFGMYGEKGASLRNVGTVNVYSHGYSYQKPKIYGMYLNNATGVNSGTIMVERGQNFNSIYTLYGVYAENGATFTNETNGQILMSTRAKNSYGIYADNATIINKGTISVSMLLPSQNEYNYGIYAVNNSLVKNEGTIIIMADTYSHGSCTGADCYNAENPEETENYIHLDDTSTFSNSATLSSPAPMNLSSFGGTMLLSSGGSFEAPEISGDLGVSQETVSSGFGDTYTLSGAIIAENTENLNLYSQSAMFTAKLEGQDVVLQKKGFKELLKNDSFAEFLEKNYAAQKNENLFKSLKENTAKKALQKAVNELLGDGLKRFAFEDFSAFKEMSFNMNEALFADKQEVFELSGSTGLEMFEKNLGSSSRWGVNGKRVGQKMFAFGVAYTNLSTEDKNKENNRKDEMFQMMTPFGYKYRGFELISTPTLGYAYGTYDRDGYEGRHYDGSLDKRIFGLMNELRYPLELSGWNLSPTLRVNALGYRIKGHEDNNEYALRVEKQTVWSAEAGMGFNLSKDYKFKAGNKLNLTAGAMIYHEFANPYELKLSMSEMAGNYKVRDEKRRRERLALNGGLEYEFGNISVSGSVLSYIDSECRTKAEIGLKYNF